MGPRRLAQDGTVAASGKVDVAATDGPYRSSYLNARYAFASTEVDSGSTGLDSGSTGLDSGSTGLDSGSTGLDSGSTGLDSESIGLDAESISIDSGSTLSVDAAPFRGPGPLFSYADAAPSTPDVLFYGERRSKCASAHRLRPHSACGRRRDTLIAGALSSTRAGLVPQTVSTGG